VEAAKVLIIVGSKSDLPKMEECQQMLESLGVASNLVVASAHRNPRKVTESIREAEESGVEVIIAGAGMAAHLPGVVAAYTDLPVIGVPLDSGLPGGVDALFSIVQMPPGVPVAAVAVGGSKNAAVLAARILGIKYPDVAERLKEYRKKLAEGS
jgi:5-(carboxyamino)imidazole ribonucleotide mutase